MRKLFLSSLFLILTGCQEERITLTEACEGLDGFCEAGIVADSSCKRERKTVLIQAYKLESEKTPLDQRQDLQFKQLNDLEELVACTYRQSLIEYKPVALKFPALAEKSPEEYSPKEKTIVNKYKQAIVRRKQAKQKNYVHSQKYLEALANNTRDSEHPYLLYWHWSRESHEPAIEKLRKYHQEGRSFSYDMLYYLSLDYAKYDTFESKKLLLEALKAYPADLYTEKSEEEKNIAKNHAQSDGKRLHYPIIRDLISLYFKDENYKASYVWALVLHRNNDESADSGMIIDYMEAKSKDKDKLYTIAARIDEGLKEGRFRPSEFSILGI
jgi:hypothetical protein